MPSLTTDDGRKLAWRETGSGAPLVLHCGGPGCSSRYFGELPELAAQRTLLLVDPRGTGESDRPSDPKDYGLDAYAADVEALRKHLQFEQLDLVGHSHGGFVAMTWAGANPERVRRLVLASTAPRFSDEIRNARRKRVSQHEGKRYFPDAIDALRAHQEGRYANDEELADLYRREAPLFAPPGVDPSHLLAALAEAGTNADALRHFNDRVSNGMDLRPALESIEAPTLVITGDLDPFAPAAKELAGALRRPTLVMLPGADHFPFLEPGERAQWSQALLDFLAG